MKKFVLLISLSFFFICVNAQQHLPSYYEVLKNFFTKYKGETGDDNYTNFAKKKDGWYVQQIDRYKKDALLSEKMFWNIDDGKFLDLSAVYSTTNDSLGFETKIEPYLGYDWYGYDYILYYGYIGWPQDMINDFGNAGNLTDTMLDGLARAYGNKAYSYLWYQGSDYFKDKDPLQVKLKRVEFPSAERVEKVIDNIDNGIKQFEKLNAINPSYKTLIGNGNLKLFNEYMNAYHQLSMCGDEVKAKQYLEKIHLDERYINQAKNYLNSCDRNAILFTYGDNDTYQLWYVQEKLGYRKDITVINNSLLGIPVYPVLLQKKGLISFSTPESYLQDETSDIAYFKEEKNNAKPAQTPVTLHELLKQLYLKKHLYSAEYENATYSSKKTIALTPLTNNKPMTIELKGYLLLNDFMILDIIDNNLLKRPIYFTTAYTSYFDNYLTRSGIVYKLNPFKNAALDPDPKEIKGLEKFITEKYIPVTSDYSGSKSFVSFDGDNAFAGLYFPIIQYYLSKKDQLSAKKWMDQFNAKASKLSLDQLPAYRSLSYLAIQTGDNALAKKIIEMDAQYTFDAYQHPSPLKGFYSRKRCIDAINQMQSSLQQMNESSTIVADIYQKLYVE
jgi:hypothetical protein